MNHKDGSVYVLEPGDNVLLGGFAAGCAGNQENAVVLTFSTENRNDVAIAIPERAWGALAAWFASGKRGHVVILEDGNALKTIQEIVV